MSYSSVIVRAASDQSDSRISDGACLARVRREAGLDADPVLPPLDVLLGRKDRPAPSRLVVGPSRRELPSPETIVRSSVRRPKREIAKTVARADKSAPSLARRLRWPVLLCGFIGGVSGGVAFMESPVGRTPAVQQVVKQVQTQIEGAYVAAAEATTRLVQP